MSCPPGAPGPYLRSQAKVRNRPFGDQEGEVAYPPSVIRVTAEPSVSMMYSWGKPVRPLIHAICDPVLGLNTGETSGPRKLVTLWLPPPFESVIHISGSPLRDEEKAISRPLGDHAGERYVPTAEA